MRTNTYLIRTSFLLAAALALTPAIGATVTWDTSTTAGFQSGNGTWGTDSFWSSNGTTLSPWISGDTASFLGQTTAVNDTITIGSNQTIGGLAFGSATTSGNWTFSGSGLSLSANSTFTVNAGSTASIGNVITGAFGLTKAGTGNLSLTGANTYTGVTTVSAGTLTLASGASLASSGFTTAAGATLALNASTTVTTLSGFGNIQIGSGATLTLNNSTGQSIGSGGASSLASTGAFSGAGTFVKTGTGLLYVQGDFSSTTTNVTLSGGSFQFVGSSGADTNAFGTGTITVTANSTLNTFTDATRTKSSRLLNAIVVTGGTLALGTGSGGSGSLTLAGGLTATNAANVTVGGGRVILESDLAVNGTGAFTLTGGTLQLGNNTATGSINGGLAFNATAGSLIFNRSDNATYSGVFSGTGSLTQAGTGNLTLTSANTYTGVTTVSAGTLTLDSGASLASSGFTTAAGATLALNASTTVTTLSGFGNIQIGSGATLTLNNSTNQTLGNGLATSSTSTGSITGAGTFVKSGTGLLYVQGDFSSTTTNVTLSGGSFQFVGSSGADTNAFGTGTITVTANSTLNTFTDATRTKSSRLLNAIVVTGGTLALGTGSGGSGSLTLAGGLTATNAANVTVGGGRVILVSDLAINGTGAFTLTGGTLQLGNNTTTGSINGGLAFSATAGSLIFNRSDNATYSGVFSGTGSLTQAGTGNLTLTSANTYTGVTTVSAGTLTLDSGGAIGTGVVTVSGTGVLDLGGQAVANSFVVNGGTLQGGVLNIAKITATSGVISSDLSGTTGFTKTGTGTLILGGTNSYTGGTSVNGGTLLVNGTIGAITVASGGTLGGNGFVGNTSVSSGGTIAAGASVGLLNVANLTLAAGSALTWQLNDSTKIAGVGYDLIVASTLDLSGLSSGSRATLNLMTLANPGDGVSGTPVAFDKDLSQSFTLINYSSLNLGTNTNVSNLFTINLNGFVAQDGSALNAGDFAVINDAANNSLKLQYVSAVPEPSTYGLALGFLSLAVVAVRRQRRKAAAQA